MGAALSALLGFSILAGGAYDLWAATAVYLAALGLGLAVLLRQSWAPGGPGLAADFLLPIGGALSVLGLSVWGAVNPGEAFVRWLDCAAAALVFLAALAAARDDRVPDICAAILSPVLFVELAVMVHQRWGAVLLPEGFCSGTGSILQCLDKQDPGTLVNANTAAACLIAWVPLLLERWRRTRRPYWAAALAAAIGSLLLTGSVWALLCLLLASPWLAGGRLREWAGRRRGLALSVMGVGAAALLAVKLLGRTDLVPSSYLSRGSWWLAALHMLRDNPILGVGLGNYPSAYLAHQVELAPGIQHALDAHSVLFTVLAETGMAGAAAAGVLAWSWARRLAKDRRPYALGAGLLFLYSAGSLGLESLGNILWLAVLAAFAVRCGQTSLRPRRSVVIVLAGLLLCAAPYAAAPWLASRCLVSGQKSLERGDAGLALREFEAAAQIDPRSYEARRGLAQACLERFRRTSAPADLEAAVRHQKDAIARDRLQGGLWGELGEYHLMRGQRPEAEAALAQAVRLRAADPRFSRLLGRLREAP